MTDDKPTGEFDKMLDLNRSVATREMVSRMEECMRQQKVAADDLKQVVADATEAEFGPKDIAAMKKIAKLRLNDKLAMAKEELEALERIGRICQFDMFDWDERRVDG